MTRISYGYHAPGGDREDRQKQAVKEARERFPKATSINATLNPDAPATGEILVEVVVPEWAVAEYYGGTTPDLGPETPGYIGIDEMGHPLYETETPFAVAIELLELEHERLLGQHYDDGASRRTCEGCDRAYEVKVAIDHLKKGAS